jgi:histidine ammonia-lyase
VAAARALELRAPLRPAAGTGAALSTVRELMAGPGPDRFVSPELAAAEQLVRSGQLVRAAESAIGGLR